MTTIQIMQVIYDRIRELFPDDYIYLQEKPDDKKHSCWIVINSLPTSERDGDQNGPITKQSVVNVNFHVMDMSKGITNFGTLQTYANTMEENLPFELGQVTAYFEMSNLLRELDKQSHYMNVRLNVTTLN